MIAARPGTAFAFSHPAHVVALGFGAGLAPKAPGTVGTLVAWLIGWVLIPSVAPIVFAPLLAAAFALGIWACELTGRHLDAADHGAMVWDEMVAFLAMLFVLPRELDWQAAGFLLFRAFDIAKPAPIAWLERRYRGGFGVMFDDVIAAGYALLVLALLKGLLG